MYYHFLYFFYIEFVITLIIIIIFHIICTLFFLSGEFTQKYCYETGRRKLSFLLPVTKYNQFSPPIDFYWWEKTFTVTIEQPFYYQQRMGTGSWRKNNYLTWRDDFGKKMWLENSVILTLMLIEEADARIFEIQRSFLHQKLLKARTNCELVRNYVLRNDCCESAGFANLWTVV